MSNSLAIAAVTATLRNLLVAGFAGDGAVADTAFTTQPPDKARSGTTNQLNLFLYQTTPNAAWRNQSMPHVKPGESGPFFAEGRSAPGGDLPINTNGGGLSYTHTGMYGMFALQESVRQLRGEAAAQLPDVKVSVSHGPAGFFAASGTVIMTNQA